MIMVVLFVRDSAALPLPADGFMCTARRTMENLHITAAHGKINLGSCLYAPIVSVKENHYKEH